MALLSGAGMSFVIMRCFRTAHPASAWPNRVQAVGRAIGLEGGEGALVRDALFAAR